MLMRLELPHRYEVARASEAPAGISQPPVRYRPAHSYDVGSDVLLLEFRSQSSAPWIGSFACRTSDSRGLSMVISSPDPLTAFVIADGEGYSVEVLSLIHISEPTRRTPI